LIITSKVSINASFAFCNCFSLLRNIPIPIPSPTF
jgi:hypothetical protein